MIFSFLVLLSALSISVTGAYFSILGLATMFPGSVLPVIIMGSVLEFGKIISAVWLHINWKSANKLMKMYLTSAVIILMFITSMGIFGFLSKAHIEHSYLTEKETATVKQIDEKISREQLFIERQYSYINEEEKKSSSSRDINLIDIEREEKRIEQINSQLNQNIEFEKAQIDKLINRRKELDKIISNFETEISLSSNQTTIDQINNQLNQDIKFEESRRDRLIERRQELDLAIAEIESKSGGIFSDKKSKIEELKLAQAEERESIDKNLKEIEIKIDSYRKDASSEIQEYKSSINQKSEDLKKSQLEEREFISQNLKDIEFKINSYREKAEEQIKKSVDKITTLQQSRLESVEDKSEVEKYNKLINEANDRISELQVQKMDYNEKVRSLEAEIGPIKYIAKLFEDLGGGEISLDKAVRIVIIILIFVFDPLAVLLVLAGVSGLHKRSLKNKNPIIDENFKNFNLDAFTKTINELKNKVTNLEKHKDFVSIERFDRIESALNNMPEAKDIPTKEELQGIINFYNGDKKKIKEELESEIIRETSKIQAALFKINRNYTKTKNLIKQNYRRIILNSHRTRENKSARESKFRKIVSSIENKIKKF